MKNYLLSTFYTYTKRKMDGFTLFIHINHTSSHQQAWRELLHNVGHVIVVSLSQRDHCHCLIRQSNRENRRIVHCIYHIHRIHLPDKNTTFRGSHHESIRHLAAFPYGGLNGLGIRSQGHTEHLLGLVERIHSRHRHLLHHSLIGQAL